MLTDVPIIDQLSPRMRELYLNYCAARRNGKPISEDMRAGHNAYQRMQRSINPELNTKWYAQRNARNVALRALANRFPGEFAELYGAELRRRGLEPVAEVTT